MERLQHLFRRAAGPTVLIALLFYFTYQMVEGDRGLLTWWHVSRQLHAGRTELSQIEARRKLLAHRAWLLDPHHIDRDMLDEQARYFLNYVRPDEIVILRPTGAPYAYAAPTDKAAPPRKARPVPPLHLR